MNRPEIVIVTPALADANNGNWQTARRWARMLCDAYRVRLVAEWKSGDEALMIALHARRSAPSAAKWSALRVGDPLVVVLTGTDLYRDIASDASAQTTIQGADRLVVLNELGAQSLPAALRIKTCIVLQSSGARARLAKTGHHLRALMVGHLREEKSPQTYFDAVCRLEDRPDILLDHAGAALDPSLGAQATALMADFPRYRWLGALPHSAARGRIQRAHVLVHPSRMEGGAHVVIEAIRSGTPVLASRIDGNVGLLGSDYGGYFAAGDGEALAHLLRRLRDEPEMLARLEGQCRLRNALFSPERESACLHKVVADLLAGSSVKCPVTSVPP